MYTMVTIEHGKNYLIRFKMKKNTIWTSLASISLDKTRFSWADFTQIRVTGERDDIFQTLTSAHVGIQTQTMSVSHVVDSCPVTK